MSNASKSDPRLWVDYQIDFGSNFAPVKTFTEPQFGDPDYIPRMPTSASLCAELAEYERLIAQPQSSSYTPMTIVYAGENPGMRFLEKLDEHDDREAIIHREIAKLFTPLGTIVTPPER